jgi:hypothetical protein
MRIRTTVGLLVGALSVLVLARPAAAQGVKVDFSGGYQYFRFVGYYSEKLPTGWGVSVAVGKDQVKFVADVGGNYGDPVKYQFFSVDHFVEYYDAGRQVHTFQGGVEFSGPPRRVVPFVRLLTGVAMITTYGNSFSWAVTPEAGAKIMATDRVGAQIAVSVPAMVHIDGSAAGFRFFAGIVIRK